MTPTQYAELVINTNIKLGYSFEEIASDMKASMQRFANYQSEQFKKFEDVVKSEAGISKIKQLINF